jgi:hypothetical protein
MVSLIDIVPQTRTVQIQGGELEIRGLGLRQIADLLLRFPSLCQLLFQGAPAELDIIDALLISAPDAIAAIIAAAAGQPNAADALADGALSIEDLAECLVVVRDLTIPNGAVPLLDSLTRLLGTRVASPGAEPVTSSPPQPNGSSLPDMATAT